MTFEANKSTIPGIDLTHMEESVHAIENDLNDIFDIKLKGIEAVMDPFIQLVCDHSRISINTMEGFAQFGHAPKNRRYEYQEYLVIVSKMVNLVYKWFKNSYKGKEYTPGYIKNSGLNRGVILRAKDRNVTWESFYIDGVSRYQYNVIPKDVFLKYCLEFGLNENDIETIEASTEDKDFCRFNAGFSKYTHDLITEYGNRKLTDAEDIKRMVQKWDAFFEDKKLTFR